MIIEIFLAPIAGISHVMSLIPLVVTLSVAFSLGMLLMWAVLSAGFLVWWRRDGAATVASSTVIRPSAAPHGAVVVPLPQPWAA